jgi:hypothetical protein
MLDLRIIADGQPLSPLELVMKIGRPAAALEIGEQIEALIATLDQIDTDPDVELNGDELDGSGAAEDEFWPHWLDHGYQIGCPIADPGGSPLDHGEHPSDDGSPMLATKPVYQADQSAGPTNAASATEAYYRERHRRTQ